MANFILVTNAGIQALINVEHIQEIKPALGGDGCWITFISSNNDYLIKESFDELQKIITAATSVPIWNTSGK